MKKKCLCCGRNRRIGKFGRRSRYSDGKNPYCRDCMRDKRNNYVNKPIGRRKLKEAKEKWRNNNKNHISNYNKKYYKKNKERIMYNIKSKKNTESIMVFEDEKKINKSREISIITIDPKRIQNGR